MSNEQRGLELKAAAFDAINRKENIDLLKKRFTRLAGTVGFVVGLAVANLFGATTGWQILAGIVAGAVAYFGCEGLNEDRLSRHDDDALEKLAVAYVGRKNKRILIGWVAVIIVVVLSVGIYIGENALSK